MARSDSSCAASTTRLIVLGAACGLVGYGIYKLFANPDSLRRLGPAGDRAADGVEMVKRTAGAAAASARDQSLELARQVRRKAGRVLSSASRAAGDQASAAAASGEQLGSNLAES